MKLYDHKSALNTRRVRIFLAEKGIEVPVETVSLEEHAHRSEDFLAKNPLGTLPLLELDDGEILTESIAICRYFEEISPQPPLFGTTPVERARVEMWNRRMELELMRPIQDAFRNTHDWWKGRVPQVPEYGRVARELAAQRMDWLDREFAARRYAAGDSFSVADISGFCAILLGRVSDIRVGDARPNLKRWFEAVAARPSSKA